MEYRETWLASLSDAEFTALCPWRILTTNNARGYLITAARASLRGYKRFGLSQLSNDELLHEVYPILHDAIPGILANCVASEIDADNRDRFVYGSLRLLIGRRLPEIVFGKIAPGTLVYLDEVPREGYDDDAEYMPTTHELMLPYVSDVNSYLESQPNHQPQFLSESQFVPEEQVQKIHRLIEQFRPYLTHREVDVLRNLLLNYRDRSMVALEVGTTPKMISRYRQSIQAKMKSVLNDLEWSNVEIAALLGKDHLIDDAIA